MAEDAAHTLYEYQYLRDNPAGEHEKLWYHEAGDLLVRRHPRHSHSRGQKSGACPRCCKSVGARQMSQKNRIEGGQIDHSQPLKFSFDGKGYTGYAGDTLASALLANGVRLMGRSFKYHRPRGPLTAGSEEPNALVELRGGARHEPNTRAMTTELYDGLWARSQNRLGSLNFDLLAVNDRHSNFLTAGFFTRHSCVQPHFGKKYTIQ